MVGLVDLVTFPMTLFARPRSWDRMDDAMNRLLDAVRFMGEQLSSVVLREST